MARKIPAPRQPSTEKQDGMDKVAIIILNWNGKNDTLACLDSIQQLTYPHIEVIVVDNGSTDDSTAALRTRPITLIEARENLGFAEGNNIGIRYAMEHHADFLFLLNNDTTVAPDIIERFLEQFHSHPSAGILGAKIFLYDKRDTLDHLGGMWNPKRGEFDYIGFRQNPDGFQTPQELDYVCGAGLIIKRSVIEAVGVLEPRFFLIWEESDFCFRARRAGFKTLSCPTAKLWHKVSASFIGGKPHSTYFWWRNRLLWIERNCSKKEKWSLYLRIIIPEILRMLKRALPFRQELLKNRAALCGVRDYFLRRFGNGPSWIYKKDRP